MPKFDYNTDEFDFGFFAYLSPAGAVELGFKFSAVLTDVNSELIVHRDELAENALSLIRGFCDESGLSLDDIDFDLVTQDSFQLVAPEGLEAGVWVCLMIRDDRLMHGSLEALREITRSGDPTKAKIKVDLVRASNSDMRLLDFYDEMTGDMS
jgi:hypothetical protein